MGIVGKVTSKGQTTIPKAVRDQLGLVDGSQIEWQVADGRAFLVARQLRMIDLAGILGNPLDQHSTIEDMDDAMGKAIARHVLGEDEDEQR